MDLAPADEFHIRGREATVELAARDWLAPGLHVLDIGCGLGGSARYLADEHQCLVTGIDITQKFLDAAKVFTDLVGLSHRVRFRRGSAVAMPFEDQSFDVVWSEHTQMNVADKRALLGEIARVLRPGGRLFFHDIFQGDAQPLHYPVPWAEDRSIDFLITPDESREILAESGFSVIDWEDRSQASLDWFIETYKQFQLSNRPPLGLHILMGDSAKATIENQIRNLLEDRMVVVQAVAKKY